MTVYRLASSARADLTGQGAKLKGGRCNPPGVAAVYSSEHISLCVLEVLVHVNKEYLPNNYVLLTVEVPDHVPVQFGVHASALASKGRNPTWIVPSIIVPQENNIVLYPEARGYGATILNVEPFEFDVRVARNAG